MKMQQGRRSFVHAMLWLAAACCGTAVLGAAAAAPMRLAFAPAAPAAVSATAAPAAAPAAPAASAASAPRAAASAPTNPVVPAPAAAAPASAPRSAASAASAPAAANAPVSMAGGSSSLHLLVNPVPLPQGHVGVPYKRVRIVLDGVPTYSITVEGSLPQGMSLGSDGYLGGTPTVAGLSRFIVRASDSARPPTVAQQAYVLRVATPSRTPAKPASSPASAPAPLSSLTADDTKVLPAKAGSTVSAWQLTQADLDLLVPDPNAPAPAAPEAQAQAPAPAAPASSPPKEEVITEAAQAAADAEAAQMAQLRQMLLPLLQAEYPSRQLFEAALDAQLCIQVKALIAQAERSKGLPQSGGAGVVCPPPPPSAPAKAASRPSTPGSTTTTIPLSQLPSWLLPATMRADLVSIAEKRHSLDTAKPVQWTDGNCGCVHEDMVAEVYGFYPFWAAAGKPQQLNFSLLTRISTHAATFTDDGVVVQPASWGATADFAVQAQRHGTHLDLVVWRNDWKSLLLLDDQRLERVAKDLARNAIAAADTPLRDQASRWKRLLPFYASDPRLADGITVFFDNAPPAASDAAGAKAFSSFVRRFMLALIAQMREGAPRNYVINVAVPSVQIGTAPYDLDALFDYVKRAEDPLVDHQRIQEEGDIYRSRTNVTIRFIALLPEPTTQSKKALRKTLEDSRVILGNDRRVLLRKIVPVISYTGADPQQFADDLSYFRDNFGGAGFWQVPQDGVGPGTDMYEAIARTFRKDASDETSPVCKIVCTQRWAFRAVFQLLVVVLLLGLVGVAAAGGMRCAGRNVMLGLLAVAALVVLTGGGLLNCDPEFKTLREGNSLFWTVLALLFAAALFAALKPRDPRP